MNSYLPPSEKKMFSLEGDDKANRGMLTSFPSVPSPYLNYDPQLLPQSTQPEYIFLEGAGSKQRGRFELSFTEIGTSCLIGATIGGIRGIYSGIKMTSMENQTSTYNRTQILNSVFKNGARLSNTFGTLSVYYSIFGIILEKTRGCEDELNTIVAGTSTGLLYKATSGLRRCGIGGLIGFSLATAFSLITSRDKIKEMGKNFIIDHTHCPIRKNRFTQHQCSLCSKPICKEPTASTNLICLICNNPQDSDD